MFESAKLSTDSDKAQFWNSQRLKVKNFELRLTYLERLYFTELLAVQGVASCIALSMPWRSSEGAGSGQLSRLFSTQLIMASTFLQYQVSISNQNRETLEFSFCFITCNFLVGRHKSASGLDFSFYNKVRTSQGRIFWHIASVHLG